jgi:outer membrane protein OmpA-like peptidoglycan-associated protein
MKYILVFAQSCAMALTAVPAVAAPLAQVEGDAFSIKMPAQPQQNAQVVKVPGGSVAIATWTASDDGTLYSVSTTDYPQISGTSKSIADFAADSRKGLIDQLKGRLVSERAISASGLAGTESTISSDNGEVKARTFTVGNRLYTLLVLYNPSAGAPQANEFLTSFRVRKYASAQPAAAQEACVAGPYMVFFDPNSDELTPQAKAILDYAASAYAKCGRAQVMISGHTDRKGAADYNVGLSQRIASNVRSYLVSRGVPDGVTTTQSFGESRPLVETEDGIGEPQNRRAEITFGPGAGW